MRVFHFCQYKVKHSNGVQSAVWELAVAQNAAGHEIEIISLGREPSMEEVEFVRSQGIKLSGVRGKLPQSGAVSQIAARIRETEGALCHLHSVFVPWHSLMARALRRHRIPYVIAPHGNLATGELRRKRLRKRFYLALVEKSTLAGAAGFLCASERERESIRSVLSGRKHADRFAVVGNCVRLPSPELVAVQGGAVRGISLGKSDVRNKAYDRMFEVARAFPDGVDFYVIAHNQRAWKEEFEALARAQSGNEKIRIHGGVHGAEKAAAFARARVCLHLARWEVFGMAIVEAAMHGLALVLSSECDIAAEAEEAGAAYVMHSYDGAAIDRLGKWLRDGPALRLAAERAREWASARYSAPAVAAKVLQFYQQCLA